MKRVKSLKNKCYRSSKHSSLVIILIKKDRLGCPRRLHHLWVVLIWLFQKLHNHLSCPDRTWFYPNDRDCLSYLSYPRKNRLVHINYGHPGYLRNFSKSQMIGKLRRLYESQALLGMMATWAAVINPCIYIVPLNICDSSHRQLLWLYWALSAWQD